MPSPTKGTTFVISEEKKNHISNSPPQGEKNKKGSYSELSDVVIKIINRKIK